MNKLEERFLIYTALLLLCAFSSVFLGVIMGLWAFVQMAAVIELMYYVGAPRADETSGS